MRNKKRNLKKKNKEKNKSFLIIEIKREGIKDQTIETIEGSLINQLLKGI